MIFLDTSFLYALAVVGDAKHEESVRLFSRALGDGAEFVIHNLILVETMALLQNRHGMKVAQDLARDSRHFRTLFIDKDLHEAVLDRFAGSGKRGLSLVDMFSFAIMRREAIKYALAFDEDFTREGFSIYG